ncbi:MAG TPA: hypothetical protein VGM56_29075 [Byssovorax sp.]|jgi:hypothetical protein
MRIELVAAAAALTVVAGCSAGARTSTPREPFPHVEVQTAGSAPTPASCVFVARIEGRDEEARDGLTYRDALLALRRSAAQAGGNYVVIEAVEPRDASREAPAFAVTGRLFACDARDVRPMVSEAGAAGSL